MGCGVFICGSDGGHLKHQVQKMEAVLILACPEEAVCWCLHFVLSFLTQISKASVVLQYKFLPFH